MRLHARVISTIFYTIPPLDYFRRYHYSLHFVSGPSMAPSLSPDYHATQKKDCVLFRMNVRVGNAEGDGDDGQSELERGMVVLFKSPYTGRLATKRIIALEGDEVTPIQLPSERLFGYDPIAEKTVIVPFGHVWVEGDQVEREKTIDSNNYGPLSKSLIEGIAHRIVWPRSRREAVSIHGDWEKRCSGRVKHRKIAYDNVPEEWAMI